MTVNDFDDRGLCLLVHLRYKVVDAFFVVDYKGALKAKLDNCPRGGNSLMEDSNAGSLDGISHDSAGTGRCAFDRNGVFRILRIYHAIGIRLSDKKGFLTGVMRNSSGTRIN